MFHLLGTLNIGFCVNYVVGLVSECVDYVEYVIRSNAQENISGDSFFATHI